MGKSLNDIKRDIALLTMDIESLDPDSKHSAISHLEETVDLLKIGAEHDQEMNEVMDTLLEENPNNEDPENESNIDHGKNERIETQQTPNNEIKQEPVNQEPVILSLSPDNFQGQIDNVNDTFKCEPCDVYLPKSYTLQHEQDPKHQARVSNEESVGQTALSISNEENSSANVHKCNLCHKQYKNRYDLLQHNHVHTGRFSCRRCNAAFRRRRELEKHSRRAENCSKLQKFRSSTIFPSFATNDKLTKPDAETRANTSKSEFAMQNASSLSFVSATETSKINEESSPPVFQCPKCPNQYNNRKSFMRHENMHTGKYKCQRCEAPFREKFRLEQHSRNPENCLKLQRIRSFPIVPAKPELVKQDIEETTNKAIKPLVTDILTHNLQGESSPSEGTDSKPLQCPDCPKQYFKRDSLTEHRIIHTGRFKCQRCGASFSTRSKLIKHSRNPASCTKLQKFRLNSLIKRQSVTNRSRLLHSVPTEINTAARSEQVAPEAFSKSVVIDVQDTKDQSLESLKQWHNIGITFLAKNRNHS